MSAFVIDGSVAVAWFMPDEHDDKIQKLLDQVAEDGAVVPGIWHLEVGNALLVGTRSRRISLEDRHEAFQQLRNLPVAVDSETLTRAWDDTLDFANRFQLTIYDACYLELAHRRALPLATLDKDLRKAANKLGVLLF